MNVELSRKDTRTVVGLKRVGYPIEHSSNGRLPNSGLRGQRRLDDYHAAAHKVGMEEAEDKVFAGPSTFPRHLAKW